MLAPIMADSARHRQRGKEGGAVRRLRHGKERTPSGAPSWGRKRMAVTTGWRPPAPPRPALAALV